MKVRQYLLPIIALGSLVACGHMAVKSFTVNNQTECQDTGHCELFLQLEVEGRAFSQSRDYQTPSNHDSITINWGDGTGYDDTVPSCIDDGICQFIGDGIMLNHDFALASGARINVTLDGDNFDDIKGTTLVGTFGERDSTAFASYNVGLANTQVDYYYGRRDLMLDSLNTIDADVVCLQEVWKESDADTLANGLAHKFPYNYVVMQNTHPANWSWGHNGLMILSRYPIKDERMKQLDYYFIRRSVLYTTVETELHGDLDILCTHTSTAISIPPYWGDFDSWEDEQNHQTRDILDSGEVDVMLGDFNTSPEGPGISAYTPEPYYMVTEAGYFSPYMEAAPGCTWCVENPIASDGDGDLILDHIFFNKIYRDESFQVERIFDETLEVKDFWGNPQSSWLSDHAGIRVELME
jgi:endonuclease/exonuclease/phosphatase family metal-dependent hydrolase